MNHENTSLSVMLAILTLVVVGFVLHLGQMILLPLIIAFLLCKLSEPLIRRCAHHGIPWPATVSGLMLAIVLLLFWLGGALFENARSFLAQVDYGGPSEVVQQAGEPAEASPVTWDAVRQVIDEGFGGQAGEFDWDRIEQAIKSVVPRLAGLFAFAVLTLLQLVNQVFLVLFFMLFIFAEQRISHQKILQAAGRRSSQAAQIMSDIDRDVHRYLSVKTGISAATGAICFLGLWIMDVPYAALFGLLTFLLNFIPTFGSILAALFPVVAAWIHHESFAIPAAVLLLYLAVNLVFGNLIEPRVLGKQLNLSPLVILIAVLFWSALWGVAGMFLAVPLTRTVQLVFAHLPTLRGVAILMSNGEALRALSPASVLRTSSGPSAP